MADERECLSFCMTVEDLAQGHGSKRCQVSVRPFDASSSHLSERIDEKEEEELAGESLFLHFPVH